MWQCAYESLKTVAALLVAVVAVIGFFLLSGCDRIEGAGFENSGRRSLPACVTRDARGNEDWRSC